VKNITIFNRKVTMIITDQFGMKEALAQLGVQSINEGTSTGINNFSNGAILESYSPVDGQRIASVKQLLLQITRK
jgi:hypothetical protein